MNQQRPERVIVQPTVGPLRPDLEWDDRDQVTGHRSSARSWARA